ncbi:MAG TPA: SRPBCC family protein [Fontimonas sp.]
MTHSIRNRIRIGCTPAQLYAYVTQPWRWHEWHPNSKSAQATVATLQAGDCFDEVVEIQPLPLLPLRLRRATRYRVLIAEPSVMWKVEGTMDDGRLCIQYAFEPDAGGVLFTRTLDYEVLGIHRLLLPLLRPRMAAMSVLALSRLKRKMEGSA